MEKNPTKFRKIFGSGPVALFISIVLFLVAIWLNRRINLPPISNNRLFLKSVFLVSIFITLGMITWSVKSLPAADRGNKLHTAGAFKYFRHPLYAAFLSVFNFGLAIFLNSYIFVVWAALLHSVWHFMVRDEERMMVDIFGQAYLDYQMRTGRFFPKLLKK